LFQRWTNNYWHSPIHRVVNSTVTHEEVDHHDHPHPATANLNFATSKIRGRQAIVVFTGPLEECVIDPSDVLSRVNNEEQKNLIKNANEGDLFSPVKTKDYFLMKINRTNQLQNLK
jgi:hypothetical protein